VRSALRRHAAAPLAVGLGLVLAACNASAVSTPAAHTPAHTPARHPSGRGRGGPPRDTFVGSIVSATGAYSGYRGQARVYLHPSGSGRTRPARVVLRADCVTSRGHCRAKLDGTLRGTLTAAGRTLPDTGIRDILRANGRIGPLGNATARGWVQGTGFIAHGHELMQITLRTASGSITLQARSLALTGFTSP
jgi:hypothetical protein